MKAWIKNDIRMDMEFAVLLELGAGALERAVDPQQQAAALAFNRDIWRVIGMAAPSSPVEDDRVELSRRAAQPVMDYAVENRKAAFRLAARAAGGGALRRLLGDWQKDLKGEDSRDFGAWLLVRMEKLTNRPELIGALAA